MQITIKIATGKTIILVIEPTDTIDDVKQKIQNQEGIPPHMQLLVFHGKVLLNEKTLADYDIQNGAIIHLIMNLRGD